jgi:uncharacterized protein (TIGR00725 family)
MQVAVIGPGDEATARDRRHAYEVGRRLAEAGAVVITGGLGGVMAEAARGCTEAGGTTVGLLPGSGGGNDYLTVALPTGMGEMRNALIVRCADGVIAIGGSWGTVSELALAQRTGVPLVSLDGWQIAAADGTPVDLTVAPTPGAAVDLITALIAAASR